MTVEILFSLTYLLAIKQAHVAKTGFGQTVDDRTAQEAGQNIIDQCANVCTQGGKRTMSNGLMLPSMADLYAAGGTTNSLGKGMKLLSMAIRSVMFQ